MRPCIGTVKKLAVIHVGRAQNIKIRNILVKTFHLIYYMTTFQNFNFLALDDLAPSPRKGPKI
jgi:hypothetical protein